MTEEIKKIYKTFQTQEDCIIHLEKIFWDNIPICPYCNSTKKTDMKFEKRYHCNHCRTSYSVTAKTMFHKSKVDLQKWFYVIKITIFSHRSSRQIAKEINVTKDTACFMVKRIRESMKQNLEITLNIIK